MAFSSTRRDSRDSLSSETSCNPSSTVRARQPETVSHFSEPGNWPRERNASQSASVRLLSGPRQLEGRTVNALHSANFKVSRPASWPSGPRSLSTGPVLIPRYLSASNACSASRFSSACAFSLSSVTEAAPVSPVRSFKASNPISVTCVICGSSGGRPCSDVRALQSRSIQCFSPKCTFWVVRNGPARPARDWSCVRPLNAMSVSTWLSASGSSESMP